MGGKVERSQPTASSESEVWGDLVTAMLSVGGFSAEKVLKLRNRLREAGLLDPRNLSSWDEARVTRELTAAGYERGLLTGMYAERLAAAMRVLASEASRADSEAVLASLEADRISELLLPQKGIGPKVVESFLELRRAKQPTPEQDRE
jgi:endonuclease III-like uncharacterized protein